MSISMIAEMIRSMSALEPLLCVVALAAMWRAGELRRFRPVGLYLASKLTEFGLCYPILLVARHGPHNHTVGLYNAYYFIYWPCQVAQAIFGMLAIYSVFQTAMAPMKGLRWLGSMVFRWVAGVSILVSLALSIGPNQNTLSFIRIAAAEFQRTASILSLCLLLFVCFAITPLGLTFRSRIFGIMLGLGIFSTVSLVESAWILHMKTMFTWLSLLNATAILAGLAIWSVYFIVPEPRRRFILLPTTSPFHKWNQISLALGVDPGYVAVGGVGPDAFAPAELEFMRIASVRMRESAASQRVEVAEAVSSVA